MAVLGFIVLKLLQVHVYVSILNIVLYEGLKWIFGGRIIANGWKRHYQEEDPEFYENVSTGFQFDILSIAIMFIPLWNISFTMDLLDMIMFTPEQIGEMDKESDEHR